MLSFGRAITSPYAAGAIGSMMGDNQRVDDRGQSCTARMRKSRTIRVPLYTISMQDQHDDFLPDH